MMKSALARGVLRHPMLVVNSMLLVMVGLAGFWRYNSIVSAANSPTPADLFMQSVAAEDGNLGWHQLCPALQAELPRDVLEQQTQTLRDSHTQTGVTLTIDHIGDWPRASGGEIRVYVATAHAPGGSTGQKTYVLQTQANGCVESVQ
jgi:hypothetical protein